MIRPATNRLRALLPATLATLVAACAGGTTTAPPGTTGTTGAATTAATAAPAGTKVAGECTITVTGDREETLTFAQSIYSFSSDHWIGEDELRGTVEALGEDIAGGSFEEITARGEPVITFFSVSCADPDNLIQGVTATHTNGTLVGAFPEAPGSYPITGGLFNAGGTPGTVIADFSYGDDELYRTIPDSGTLDITRWDSEAVEGSLSFSAEESFVEGNPRRVTVTVGFSFLCDGWFSGCS